MKGLKAILVSVLLVDIAELLLRYGLKDITLTVYNFLPTIFTPSVFFGLLFVGMSSFFWLTALSKEDLSLAYPMISIGYVVVAVLSYFLFHENLSPYRLIGIFIICGGVFLMSRT